MEEEKLFEYRLTANDDYIRRMYRYLVFTRPPRLILYGVFGVLWIAFIVIAIVFTVKGLDNGSIWVSISAYTLFFAIMPLNYFVLVSTRKKQLREMHGGAYPEDCGYFTESALHIGVNGAEMTTTLYDQIRKCVVRKDAVVLTTKARMLYYLDRTGFTKGTPEELAAFLHGKGVK